MFKTNNISEPNLKLKMRVQLVNAAGLDEAGIDGGGIFREFLNELLKTGFDPNRGFFSQTTDRLLYPNPQASVLVEDFTKHYYFLGRMLGKVYYYTGLYIRKPDFVACEQQRRRPACTYLQSDQYH